MVRKKQIIIAVAALIATFAIAAGTIALLSRLNKSDDTSSKTSKEESRSKDEEETAASAEQFETVIDEQKNSTAKSSEDEATSLMESDPAKAKEKYREAQQAYVDAGNIPKASEMDANAITAELLVQQNNQL